MIDHQESSLASLREKIKQKSARLAVIGLGYVGLPVACQYADAGFEVLGIEHRADRVEIINSGVSPIEGEEPGLKELVERVISSGKMRATTNYQELFDIDVILIAVETPVDRTNQPRYQALRSAVCSLGPVLKEGAMVIVESTIAPGTMTDVVLPLLEESSGKKVNQDFFLGNCPERVMPGKLLLNLKNLSRVLGGMSPETANTMQLLYKQVINGELDVTDCITAELVKTVENTYRDVQIAFANEVALICEAVGGDVWKVRDLVNKTPYRQMHLPGAGVGGHCIPKDPLLLAYGVRDKEVSLRLIPAARTVNNAMPMHIVDLLADGFSEVGKTLHGTRILVLGYSYLEDSDDTRNSPSEVLVRALKDQGAQVIVHDPFVSQYTGDLYAKASGCDAAVLMVKHKQYSQIDLNALKSSLHTPVFVDGRGFYNTNDFSDWIYRKVGMGN
ncbi:MAG TPA: nucleotide sugar dehydrogenase [Bellilinea sp.]|nr:nucleotide sugar dehydrogenase [Bellilinea sp.]